MHEASPMHAPSTKRHRPSTPTVFGAAFVAGAVASFGINSFFDAHIARSRPQVESEPIFVALRSMPQGTPVTVWDVALRDWPRAMLPQSVLRAEDRFEGLVLKHPLREGQPLLSVQLAPPAPAGDLSGTHSTHDAEAFAAPVPAQADMAPATAAATDTRPSIASDEEAAASLVARDDVEVFAAVERFEPPVAAPATTPASTSPASTSAEPIASRTERLDADHLDADRPDGDRPDGDCPDNGAVAETPQPGQATAVSTDSLEAAAEIPPPAEMTTPADTAAQPFVDLEYGSVPSATAVSPIESTETAATVVTRPDDVDQSPHDAGGSTLPADVSSTTAGSTAAAGVQELIRKSVEQGGADGATGAGEPVIVPPSSTVFSAEPIATDVPTFDPAITPLPPISPAAGATSARPPVPALPGSDIEGALAIMSRQRAAQTAAKRPGSVIASPDPYLEQPLPVPVTPTTDVARSLETTVAAQQSTVSAPATLGEPAASTVATPPLRHLVVPERIAMQADASFVSPRPMPAESPTQEAQAANSHPPAATSMPVGTTARPTGIQPGNNAGAGSGPSAAPRGTPARQPRPETPPARTAGPVMKAISGMFPGFVAPSSPEATRQR